MKLRGRNLSLQTALLQGNDVKLLQDELRQLGYTIPGRLPTDELLAQSFGQFTSRAVLDFQARNGLPTTGIVDGPTAEKINAAVEALQPPSQTFVVQGQVRQSDGTVFVGAIVRAADKELRSETPLGEAIADGDGRYEIKYTVGQLSHDEKPRADLIVRVFSPASPAHSASAIAGRSPSATISAAPTTLPVVAPVPLATSAVIFNAPPVATVDLMVGGGTYAGPSEYEELVAKITPELDSLKPADLTDEDVAFLARELELPSDRISLFAVAARLAKQTELPPEVFYGMASEKLPTDLHALLAIGQQAQRQGLEAALKDNVVPLRLSSTLDSVLARLQRLVVSHALDGMQPPGQPSFAALIGTVLSNQSHQEKLMTLWVQRTGSVQDFWKTVGEQPEFAAPGQVDALKMTIQLSVLAQNHLPMLQQLQQMRQQGQLKSLRDLAKLDTSDWLKLVQTPGVGVPPGMPGKDDAEKAQNYAAFMNSLVEKAFPTAVIGGRVQKESPRGNDLTRFFANSPDFEFGTTHIDSYLAANKSVALAGVQAPDVLTKQLKAMQRIFTVTTNYGQMKVLQGAGLNSARSIARMGKIAFVSGLGDKLGGASEAEAIYARAQRAATTALAIFGRFAPAMNSIDLAVTRRQP